MHEEAGLRRRLYVPVREYPDEVVLELVGAAAELTDAAPDELLSEFGRFLVPLLTSVYGVHVDGEWTGLELIANVETYIHEALRGHGLATFTPPKLQSERLDDDRVVVYASDRGLCALAEGLLVGVGEQYDEPLSVDHWRCVHEWSRHCGFLVTRETRSAMRTAATDGIGQRDDRPSTTAAEEHPSEPSAEQADRPTSPRTD